MYKKIILTILIGLSFQSMAQTADLEMNKILEPSREEKQRIYYKELNEKLNPKLINDEKAALVTEEQCFADAYEQLKTYALGLPKDTNTKYKGYDKHIKDLTEFTNSKARGMGCKKTTLFYMKDIYKGFSDFVKSEDKNIQKLKEIKNKEIESDRIADQQIRTEKDEKEFNSNPKNFPYRETWYDYEKGVYEIKLTEITDLEQIKNIKEKYKDKLSKELCSDKKYINYELNIENMKEIYFYEYSHEDINGFFVNSQIIKELKIDVPFLGKIIFKNKKEPIIASPEGKLSKTLFASENSENINYATYYIEEEKVMIAKLPILSIDLNNQRKKIYISFQFSTVDVPYYLSLEGKHPELFKDYMENNLKDPVIFSGYNLNDSLFFQKNKCNIHNINLPN